MCMGGYSIRLEGLEDPGFCSHLGVRMADGRNGLRATAANTIVFEVLSFDGSSS